MKETPQTWLSSTCDDCNITELKAICARREFSSPPKSRGKDALSEYVKLRLLSPQGVRQAFEALSLEDQILLHLLKLKSGPVNVEKLYPLFTIHLGSYASASDYRQAFLSIKKRLVLSGLVLVKCKSLEYAWSGTSKWQLYEFLLPREISEILPPLSWDATRPEKPAKKSNIESILSAQLQNDVTKIFETQNSSSDLPGFRIEQGSINFGSKTAPLPADVQEKIREAWLRLDSDPKGSPLSLKAGKVRGYFLGQIPSGDGVTFEKLAAVFSACFCAFTDASAKNFRAVGNKFGFITPVNENGDSLLVPKLDPEIPLPSIKTAKLSETQEAVLIQIGTDCNLSALLQLGRLSDVSLERGQIQMKPSIIKIGQNFTEMRESEFIKQIKNYSPLFRKIFAEVKRRTGKFTIHSNVCVVKLGGLDIKANLIKGAGKLLVDLGDEYYAVSSKDLPFVIKQSEKKGFAPKYVKWKQQLQA